MNIQNLKGAVMATSVYAAGTQIGVNVHITLPTLTPTSAEVTAAGGTINLPITSKIEAMECTITKTGIDKEWLKAVKPEAFDLIANIVQQSVAPDGRTTPDHIKAYMRVAPSAINGLEASYGETSENELTYSVLSYKLTVNGETYTHVDPVKGFFIVGGHDYNDAIKSML